MTPAAAAGGKHPIPRALVIGMIVSTLLYVWLCLHLPISLRADGGLDDALYLLHAQTIVSGHWLGPFNQFTLAKGPGFPVFLALSHALRLPIALSLALLYAGACVTLAVAIFRLSGSPALAFAIFLAMQWHPGVLPVRIIRDNIYPAQTLLILACVIQAFLIRQTLKRSILWALAAGFFLGWLWITREEGIWIVPGLLLLFGARFWQLRREPPKCLPLAAGFMAILAAGAVVWSVIATLNLINYRAFTVVDFKGSAYSHALDALQNVRAGKPLFYLPMPGKARAEVYRVSPSFATLKPYLEATAGLGQKAPACVHFPETCGDIAGAWFIWTLRDAAASTGHYGSEADADRFFKQITREVKAACAAGKLSCRTGLIGYMPAVPARQWRKLPQKLWQIEQLLTWQVISIPTASTGPEENLDAAGTFLGNPRRTPASYEPGENFPGTAAAEKILRALNLFYRLALPVFGAAALLTYGLHIKYLISTKRKFDSIALLIGVIWCLVLCRCALLLLVDISSFQAINVLYMSAGFPLFTLAITLSVSLPFQSRA